MFTFIFRFVQKCDYCAFATFTDRHQLTSDYLDAMRTHIRRSVANGMPKATSVFIGGGTPTLVPADELMSVLAEIKLANNAEVTVECNPDDITLPMMQTFGQFSQPSEHRRAVNC